MRNDDVVLARRAAAGDRSAFEELYGLKFRLVWHIARGRLGRLSESAAEEVVQETLIRAHRKLNDFRGTTSESLNAWLREICVNLCNDHLGRNERRARLARMVTFEECLHNQAKSQNDHDTLIDLYRIRAALAELPDEQRDALVKVKVYGYEAKEVAAARGVPASTIRSQVATALTKLYVALHKDFDLPGKKDTAREGAEPPPVSEPIPEA